MKRRKLVYGSKNRVWLRHLKRKQFSTGEISFDKRMEFVLRIQVSTRLSARNLFAYQHHVRHILKWAKGNSITWGSFWALFPLWLFSLNFARRNLNKIKYVMWERAIWNFTTKFDLKHKIAFHIHLKAVTFCRLCSRAVAHASMLFEICWKY